MTITQRDKAGELFTTTCSEDEEGEYQFFTKRNWHTIQFNGYKTKGSFSAEFSVVK